MPTYYIRKCHACRSARDKAASIERGRRRRQESAKHRTKQTPSFALLRFLSRASAYPHNQANTLSNPCVNLSRKQRGTTTWTWLAPN